MTGRLAELARRFQELISLDAEKSDKITTRETFTAEKTLSDADKDKILVMTNENNFILPGSEDVGFDIQEGSVFFLTKETSSTVKIIIQGSSFPNVEGEIEIEENFKIYALLYYSTDLWLILGYSEPPEPEYTEGTWTGTWTGSDSGSRGTGTQRWTKIGNQVTVYLRGGFNLSSFTGNLELENLPFAPVNHPALTHFINGSGFSYPANTYNPYVFLDTGQTKAQFFWQGSGVAPQLTGAHITGPSAMTFTLTYRTA